MEKNNKGLIIVVILLVLAVLGLVCYICYDKGVFGGKKDNSNGSTETKTEITEKEQDYDKEKAKELIDIYYYTGNSPDVNLFTDGMTAKYKKYRAIMNLSTSDFQKISCDDLDGFSRDGTGICISNNNSSIFTEGKMVEYDVLNKKYQYLFGKEENVEKKDFEYLLFTWKYDSSRDSFILYTMIGGGNLIGPYFSTYGIQSAKVKGENLTIDVGYVFFKPTDIVKISGEELSFTEEEIYKAGFEKEFQDKYLDKLDTYEFTFKYEDDHYVFVDMQKK